MTREAWDKIRRGIRKKIRGPYGVLDIEEVEKPWYRVARFGKLKATSYPPEFKKKRSVLLKNATCERCNNDYFLQVHHKDKNKHNNKDSNLEVLCFHCHKTEHKHLNLPNWPWVDKILNNDNPTAGAF